MLTATYIELLALDVSSLLSGDLTRLGIIKEMQPQYVATFSEKPAVLEGHPFVVEAGVSLGGAEVRQEMLPWLR